MKDLIITVFGLFIMFTLAGQVISWVERLEQWIRSKLR